MSSDIVKGMAAHYENLAMPIGSRLSVVESEEAMRAALLWLADNVSDEMAKAVCDEGADEYWRERISAAIRAAAGGGE